MEVLLVNDVYSPSGFALEIFKRRYAIHEHETWVEACDRVAQHIAYAEIGDVAVEMRSKFNEILTKNLFMPGGRIWFGSGRPRGQLMNCYVVPTSDSREGWGKTVSDMIVISGTGGGLGMNCSPIRPRGSSINGTGGVATGAVSLMEIINAAGEVIVAGGGRRTALMLCLNLDHGDLQEFLDKKLDLKKLNNANVSVVFNENPEEFFKLVKKGGQLELKFRGKVVGKLDAKAVWDKIVANSLRSGEPGILNGYLANRMSNVWYYKPLISTNPCSELWLIEHDACDLGSLVLPRFVTADREIDYELLKRTISTSVRFLDNVLTVNNYPLPEIEDTCSKIRRVGLGIMGLHDMLLMCGLKYNSDAGLEFVDKVMGTIKSYAYEASSDLAVEKGSFPKFEPEQFLKSGFCKSLKPSLKTKIREQGIRNCTLLTIAPTGTTSIVCDCTSGIEPMFAAAHIRRWRDGDEAKEETVVHPLFRKFVEEGRSVKHFQGAYDISIKDHLEMQRTCQKHIDSAVSKTVNLPQGTSHEQLSDLIMEFLPDLKGMTVYADGSRENQPLTPLSVDDAMKAIESSRTGATEGRCKGGSCDI